MDDQHLHIHLNANGHIPEPEIPVDEAWAGMAQLLNAEMPVSPSNTPNTNPWGKGFTWVKMLGLFTAAVSVCFIVYFSTQNNAENNKPEIIQKVDTTEVLADSANYTANRLSKSKSTDHSTLLAEKKQAKSNNETPAIPAEKFGKKTNPVSEDKREQKINNKSQVGTFAQSNPKEEMSNFKVKAITKQKNTSGKLKNISGKNTAQNKTKTSDKNQTESKLNNKPNQANYPLLTTKTEKDSISQTRPNSYLPLLERLRFSTASEYYTAIGNYTGSHLSVPEINLPTGSAKINLGQIVRFFDYSLQWNIAVPYPNSTYYLTSVLGSKPNLAMFIPELHLSHTFKAKHTISLRFAPSKNFSLGSKLTEFSNGTTQVGDTTVWGQTNTNLIKTSAMAIGLNYTWHITDKLNIGAGVAYNLQRRLLLAKSTIYNLNGKVITDSLFSYKPNETFDKYLNRQCFSANLEAGYTHRQFEAGLRAELPFNLLKNEKAVQKDLISWQLFLRLKLWK